MKIQELRDKSKDELKKLLSGLAEKQRELNFKIANKQLKNIREVRVVKKDVAKIHTVMKESEAAVKI